MRNHLESVGQDGIRFNYQARASVL